MFLFASTATFFLMLIHQSISLSRGVGMDAHADFVVGWKVAFRLFGELLFFACPKNK